MRIAELGCSPIATHASATGRPFSVRSSVLEAVPGGGRDSKSWVAVPWRNSRASGPVSASTVQAPRSTTAAASRSARYSSASRSTDVVGRVMQETIALTGRGARIPLTGLQIYRILTIYDLMACAEGFVERRRATRVEVS